MIAEVHPYHHMQLHAWTAVPRTEVSLWQQAWAHNLHEDLHPLPS